MVLMGKMILGKNNVMVLATQMCRKGNLVKRVSGLVQIVLGYAI